MANADTTTTKISIGIPWRKRLREEMGWSYPMHSLDEPDGRPTMQHMLEQPSASATRPTVRHGSNVVDIRKCMAPYRPIIPHKYWDILHISLMSMFLQRVIYPLNNGTFYIRSAILAIALHVLYFDVTHYPPHNLWVYMFYLTHWGHCINTWYLLCSWMCCLMHTQYHNESKAESSLPIYDSQTKPSRLIKHTWSMYATAAPLSLAITLLYWTAIAPVAYGPETFSYVSVMEHGGICLLVLVDGLCVGSVPLRAKQFVYLMSVCVAYLLWSMVNFALDLGNGEWPEYDDDALYPVLQWGVESRRLSAMISAVVIVVICPVLYWMAWMLSLVSFEKRYRDDDCDEPDNGAMNDCCCTSPSCCCVCSNKQCLFEGRNRPLLQMSETGNHDQEMGTMYNEMSAYPTGRLA